jgi:hypothetical protein
MLDEPAMAAWLKRNGLRKTGAIHITSGDTPFRKAYIQAVVDRIEVDDGVVRIIGDKASLEQAVAGLSLAADGVRRCVPKWRAIQDKNANTYLIETAV